MNSNSSYYFRGRGFFWIIILHIVALLLLGLGAVFGATSETNKLYLFLNQEIWYIFGLFEPIIYFFCWKLDHSEEQTTKQNQKS